MKNQSPFIHVKLGDIISFQNAENEIDSAVVTQVDSNKFTATNFGHWVNNHGIHSFHDRYFTFYKTGTKTNSRYNYGSAIAITSNVNL